MKPRGFLNAKLDRCERRSAFADFVSVLPPRGARFPAARVRPSPINDFQPPE